MKTKRLKKLKKALKKELDKEKKTLKSLRNKHPELFRKCQGKTCCQALNLDGKPCSRPAMTDKTYINKIRCCLLCWQHSLMYGVYAFSKLSKTLATLNMDWDTYCGAFPKECENMMKVQKAYT